ncbi:hypothetical protein BWI93_11590 [Siphonobacter sp. BAB-5385]|uniref:hypothetical protein n=1 Tax=Siphonobacter sp. BAB-5385 TaxID=1864822 RepID=UPI000B9E79D6|nr:hypothetical protein [Siphonobacter sp. BAB-5385]OZI07991.1 hypothetical protein BWI93_11590 [Siphonobacter sp. BAB-5385]
MATRKAFTSTLATHGVKQEGYRNCTNAVYAGLFGGTSEVVRMKKGLEKSQNIRDHLSRVELAAVQLAESLATENIENHSLRGNAQCELACTRASKSVGRAIIDNRKSFQSS